MPNTTGCDALRDELIAFALTFPEAWQDFPWEEPTAKVRKKIFAFFGRREGECLRVGVKLPETADAILQEPWAEPSSHGLGRHGWVTLGFDDPEDVPIDLLFDLIVESYVAVAPKRLAAAYLAAAEL
ncbi:MAG: MmcQ/YjbR family DNA-binding protein [Chloroflexi bacterium]|nr:MmcQ/YjbR family DNA-binding protein [Chloroflexota bacterium]MDA1147182.1 MmcQ/YjbR family DNA-binding protein [Chloroflexota bacterium]